MRRFRISGSDMACGAGALFRGQTRHSHGTAAWDPDPGHSTCGGNKMFSVECYYCNGGTVRLRVRVPGRGVSFVPEQPACNPGREEERGAGLGGDSKNSAGSAIMPHPGNYGNCRSKTHLYPPVSRRLFTPEELGLHARRVAFDENHRAGEEEQSGYDINRGRA